MTSAPHRTTNPFDEAFLADRSAHHDALRDAGPWFVNDRGDVHLSLDPNQENFL
jgi:hypothetical protein